jgi:hypothetical protein
VTASWRWSWRGRTIRKKKKITEAGITIIRPTGPHSAHKRIFMPAGDTQIIRIITAGGIIGIHHGGAWDIPALIPGIGITGIGIRTIIIRATTGGTDTTITTGTVITIVMTATATAT